MICWFVALKLWNFCISVSDANTVWDYGKLYLTKWVGSLSLCVIYKIRTHIPPVRVTYLKSESNTSSSQSSASHEAAPGAIVSDICHPGGWVSSQTRHYPRVPCTTGQIVDKHKVMASKCTDFKCVSNLIFLLQTVGSGIQIRASPEIFIKKITNF